MRTILHLGFWCRANTTDKHVPKTGAAKRFADHNRVFDRQIATAAKRDDLVVLDLGTDDNRAYAAANEAIIRETLRLAEVVEQFRPPPRRVAILVWEGAGRQGSDATAAFGELARKARFEEITITTS
jgi:hypothetical protein